MDLANQFIGICRDDRKGTYPLTCARLFPVLPKTCNAERRAILHGNSIGLLGLLAFDRLPLEEPIHGHDAPAQAVCIPEGWQSGDGLALGVDRLSPSGRVRTPMRNEAPLERIERHFAGLVIAPDDKQLLARRGIPARRIVVDAAVTHVHAVDNGITKRSAALNYPATHDRDVGIDVTRRSSLPQINRAQQR